MPAVLSAEGGRPIPGVIEAAGRTAWLSLLVKVTVPTYPVATLPKASEAVTVNDWVVPAESGVGKPVTFSELAAAPWTTMFSSVPMMAEFAVSVAVIASEPAVLKVTVNVWVPSFAGVKV